MSVLSKVWAVLHVCLFAVSVLTLSFVQTRLIRRGDWRLLKKGNVVQLYWRELSPLQRWLLYPGIAAFFLTFFGAMAIEVAHHVTRNGTYI